jgi:hypothetical protein
VAVSEGAPTSVTIEGQAAIVFEASLALGAASAS